MGTRDGAGPAAWAEAAAITAAMSLPEKAGQLLVAAVPGTSAGDGGAALVRTCHLGGVVYFSGNVRDAGQVAALSAGLQRAALDRPPGIPLLIAVDQEGGTVARLGDLLTRFPGQMAAAAARDPALVRAQARATARQMRALGINLDYAPVADVNVNPANPVIGVRAFGSDPDLVAEMTSAAVGGLRAGGVGAVVKHFPGHGDTGADSHTGLPVTGYTLAVWWSVHAPPFAAAIAAGVDEVMVGHLAVPALDPRGRPASLSRPVVTGWLRGALGYQGVVSTDSLRMAGVLGGRGDAEAAVGAIEAGCDQLLMPRSVPAAHRAVLAAVRGGRITPTRLEESVRRVIALKLSRGLLPGSPPSGSALRSGAGLAALAGHDPTAADEALARRIARRSVTMVGNGTHTGTAVLPLRGAAVHLAGPAAPGLAAPLAAALRRTGGRLVAGPGEAGVIVVATRDAVTDPAQQRLLTVLAATGRPVVVVATGLPYDLGLLPAAAAGLATYSGAAVSLSAAAAVLTGRFGASGSLPIDVPGPGGAIVHRRGTGAHT